VPTLAVRGWPEGAALPEQRDGALVVPAPWPGAAGFDLVGLGAEVPDGVTVLEGEAGRAWLERARILAGVPAMGSELGPDTIPAAAGVVDAAVDFAKGCYTGQELVARVDSRGNRTPTRLVVLSGTGPAPEPGVDLSRDGQHRATVTSAVVDGDAWVGLGYLHRSVETPAELEDGGEIVVAVDRP
jgi:folate-binding protein YgfZ